MAIRFQIIPGSPAPIYRQIVDQVRAGVATGALREGDALPSVRALASELVVNPNTVAKAYAELCREGVTESRRGRGMFVGSQRQVLSRTERKRRLRAFARGFVNEAVLLGFDRDEAIQLFTAQWERTRQERK